MVNRSVETKNCLLYTSTSAGWIRGIESALTEEQKKEAEEHEHHHHDEEHAHHHHHEGSEVDELSLIHI